MDEPGCDDVMALVEYELRTIRDETLLAALRPLLVRPRAVNRPWDYGPEGARFVCWTVLEHVPSGTGIAYCPQGFGPAYPWGLVWLESEASMGMDSGWYATLEAAFRESMAWDRPNPPGYEAD